MKLLQRLKKNWLWQTNQTPKRQTVYKSNMMLRYKMMRMQDIEKHKNQNSQNQHALRCGKKGKQLYMSLGAANYSDKLTS